MSEQVEKVKVKPWQWPAEWVKDEKFWRDVATRTAAGLIVGLIGYVFLVLQGVIQSPSFWDSIASFFAAIGITGASGGFFFAMAGVLAAGVHLLVMTPEQRKAWVKSKQVSYGKKKSETIEESSPTT